MSPALSLRHPEWGTHEVKQDDTVPSLSCSSTTAVCAAKSSKVNPLPKELGKNHSKSIIGSHSADCSFPFFYPKCCFQSFGRLISLSPTPSTSSPLRSFVRNVFFRFLPPHSICQLAPFHLNHKKNFGKQRCRGTHARFADE